MRWQTSWLEWGTRFTYSEETAAMLRHFAGIKPGMRIVELGCGIGFWGLLLAEGLRGKGELLGTDRDPALIRHARKVASRSGAKVATFRTADAATTKLPAASADLVTAHRLLCVVADPEAVLAEMIRIARPGGTVLANEHVVTGSLYRDPDDPTMSALMRRRNAGFRRGFAKLYGGDHDIGLRVPEMFIAAGLTDVRVEAVLAPSGPLPFDGRLADEDVESYFDHTLAALANDRRSISNRIGGVSAADARSFARRTRETIERERSNGGLRSWPRVSLLPRIVVRGKRPK